MTLREITDQNADGAPILIQIGEWFAAETVYSSRATRGMTVMKVRSKLFATGGAIAIAAIAGALVLPGAADARAKAGKYSYGLKSAELTEREQVHEEFLDEWDGGLEGQSDHSGSAVFEPNKYKPGKKVATLKLNGGKNAGRIGVSGSLKADVSMTVNDEYGLCSDRLIYSEPFSAEMYFEVKRRTVVATYIPRGRLHSPDTDGDGFPDDTKCDDPGDSFDEPVQTETYPLRKFERKTVTLASNGSVTQPPHDFLQPHVRGSRTLTWDAKFVLKRLCKDGASC